MPDQNDVNKKFKQLQNCLAKNDEKGVHDAISYLGGTENDWTTIPDEIVERLLTLLRSEEMYKSPLAACVLNFFEFESSRLTDGAKWLCIGFLNAHGDKFLDVRSRHVVTELRSGHYKDYLKMKKPSPRQWEDYQKMKDDVEP